MKKINIVLVALVMLAGKAMAINTAAAGEFGGTAVTDYTTFTPNMTSDFTLEVQGTAGQEINLDGYYKYTPETTCTVRFAFQDRMMYVFEGSVCKVCEVARNTRSSSGIVNLITNGGFETMTSGSSYIPEAWVAYGTDKTAITWGNNSSTSVRKQGNYNGSKYYSEGSYSVIMHSNAQYLGQQLSSTLVAGETYRIIYDYCTSNGASSNGGLTYTLALGNTPCGSEIASITGHTTSTSTISLQSFESTITIPDGVDLTTVYFTFCRSGVNKCDWIDNVQLYIPDGGLKGCTNATYLEGTAYMPADMPLTDGSNMTMYLQNPSFELNSEGAISNPTGWTLTGGASTKKISSAAKGTGPIIAGSPNLHWQFWNANVGTTLTQDVSLPAGMYRLDMLASIDGGFTAYVIGGDRKTSIANGTNSVYFVSDGESATTLGISCHTTGKTLDIDDFRLYKVDSAPVTATMTIGEAHFSTFMAPFAVTAPEGVKVYSVNSYADGKITLTEGTATIPAGTPVILYSESTVSESFDGTTTDFLTRTSGLLTGTQDAMYAPKDSYVLQKKDDKVAFYHVAADDTQNVPANRAYLTLPDASAKEITIVFPEETGIEAMPQVRSEELGVRSDIYDLTGRRVVSNISGLVIKDGKKYFVR